MFMSIIIKPPKIESIGPPPEIHAKRVTELMLAHLQARRNQMLVNVKPLSSASMGNPVGQHRTVERMRKDLGDGLLDLRVRTGKRNRYHIQLIDWGLWDFIADRLVPDETSHAPHSAWLAVVVNDMIGRGPGRPMDTGAYAPLLVTRHALLRLAMRANVRTISDLLSALQGLWLLSCRLAKQYPDDIGWLKPRQHIAANQWTLPIYENDPNSAVAVLEPHADGAPRLVVVTVLDANMVTDANPAGKFSSE